jgi:hypothetical protein
MWNHGNDGREKKQKLVQAMKSAIKDVHKKTNTPQIGAESLAEVAEMRHLRSASCRVEIFWRLNIKKRRRGRRKRIRATRRVTNGAKKPCGNSAKCLENDGEGGGSWG